MGRSSRISRRYGRTASGVLSTQVSATSAGFASTVVWFIADTLQVIAHERKRAYDSGRKIAASCRSVARIGPARGAQRSAGSLSSPCHARKARRSRQSLQWARRRVVGAHRERLEAILLARLRAHGQAAERGAGHLVLL